MQTWSGTSSCPPPIVKRYVVFDRIPWLSVDANLTTLVQWTQSQFLMVYFLKRWASQTEMGLLWQAVRIWKVCTAILEITRGSYLHSRSEYCPIALEKRCRTTAKILQWEIDAKKVNIRPPAQSTMTGNAQLWLKITYTDICEPGGRHESRHGYNPSESICAPGNQLIQASWLGGGLDPWVIA